MLIKNEIEVLKFNHDLNRCQPCFLERKSVVSMMFQPYLVGISTCLGVGGVLCASLFAKDG